LYPFPFTALGAAKSWKNPVLAYIFNLWEFIPIKRWTADTKAIRLGLEALKEGKMLAIAPEGTRGNTGRMGQGFGGVTFMALHSGAPILPGAFYGYEDYRQNLIRLRRTDFHIKVGNPFYLDSKGAKVTREIRQKMTLEIMYQLSALLPPEYRGQYADMDNATDAYLRFPEGMRSNLLAMTPSTLG
jgi:1-acyl-sn-glycerol-3-phosphate acyltransferase